MLCAEPLTALNPGGSCSVEVPRGERGTERKTPTVAAWLLWIVYEPFAEPGSGDEVTLATVLMHIQRGAVELVIRSKRIVIVVGVVAIPVASWGIGNDRESEVESQG